MAGLASAGPCLREPLYTLQDDVAKRQEAAFNEEKRRLLEANRELQEIVDLSTSGKEDPQMVSNLWSLLALLSLPAPPSVEDDVHVLTSRVAELEESNSQLSHTLTELRARDQVHN